MDTPHILFFSQNATDFNFDMVICYRRNFKNFIRLEIETASALFNSRKWLQGK